MDDFLFSDEALDEVSDVVQGSWKVIVVDDGSSEPVDPGKLSKASGLESARLVLLHNERSKGAGAGRNQALKRAESRNLLFMDADDLPTRELGQLATSLKGKRFDFCLFQHHDTRCDQERRWGQIAWDQALWRAAKVESGALSPVGPEAAALLARTANYPWNKIYRTDFLREHAIGCTPILVHEDVELHWRSFLHAKTILASDRVCVVHRVAGEGRLTDRRGPERLEVFPVLARLAAEIGTGPLALPFARFATGLCDWIAGNLREDCLPELATLSRTFLDRDLPESVRQALEAEEPELVSRVRGLVRA